MEKMGRTFICSLKYLHPQYYIESCAVKLDQSQQVGNYVPALNQARHAQNILMILS